ncbi:uncharacterized protein LOC142625004 [Castanea sativa]|uniref:uncharacterized protein LOC142625004 n=1 Tax=Castanea sativa TaxID=21020 RepID=UPI003F652039
MTAALNRFISKSAKWCSTFFQLLHKWKDFTWSEECDRAFAELKAYLAHPPILSRLEKEEVLYAYMAVARHVVSLVLALLRKSDYTGRVAKRGAMLRAFDVKYMPRTTMKGQVLVDLVVEFAEELGSSEIGEILEGPVHVETVVAQCSWKLFVDGAANKKGSEIRIVMVSPDGITLEKSLRLGFSATNNEVEYEALLVGLNTMQRLGAKAIRAYCDSRLVVGQVLGEYEAKDPRMLCREDLPRIIPVESYMMPAYNELPPIEVNSTRVGPSWQDPLVAFFKEGIVLEDWVEAKKVRRKAPRYSTPSYPQSNGQAEATNKVILDGLKKRLEYPKGKWVDELPHVLWAYRTTPRRSMGETPFFMTYGAEVVIPTETRFLTPRSDQPLGNGNKQSLAYSLDLAEEQREMVAVRLAQY